MAKAGTSELRYPLGAASRVTGLSPDLLRAWERRYGAVIPERTAGGTRRYRASDIERLRLLKAAVEAGHRIGDLAGLDDDELARRASAPHEDGSPALHDLLEALDALDGPEAERIACLQLAALGPVRFARDFALPVSHAIGEAWGEQRICIASEHLGTALLRSLLGTALRQMAPSRRSPVVLFATPSGEHHEIGLLVAALTAMGAGATALYLGPDLPAPEVIAAAEKSRAAAVGLSVVGLEPRRAEAEVRAIRVGLAPSVPLWIGGSGAAQLRLPKGAEHLRALEVLEHRVALLVMGEGASR